jgi:hypothetical protein
MTSRRRSTKATDQLIGGRLSSADLRSCVPAGGSSRDANLGFSFAYFSSQNPGFEWRQDQGVDVHLLRTLPFAALKGKSRQEDCGLEC